MFCKPAPVLRTCSLDAWISYAITDAIANGNANYENKCGSYVFTQEHYAFHRSALKQLYIDISRQFREANIHYDRLCHELVACVLFLMVYEQFIRVPKIIIITLLSSVNLVAVAH